jgi:hypothetical protein
MWYLQWRRDAYRASVGKREKKSLGRSRLRWTDDIKMDHKEIDLKAVDCINLAHSRDMW